MREHDGRRRSHAGLLRFIVLALVAILPPASSHTAQVPFPCSASPALHGEWTGECRLQSMPQAEPRMDLEAEHSVSLTIEKASFEAELELAWDLEGLSDWDIETEWTSDSFELCAEVRFDVPATEWDKSRLQLAYDPGSIPLEMEATWDLYRNRSRFRVQAEADADPLRMDLDLQFDTSDEHGFRFDRADAETEFPLPGETEITWETRFSEDHGWRYTDVEFDLPACCLPAWLDIECSIRIDSEETSIELDADLSLSDIVLHRNPDSSPEPLPPVVAEFPLEARLDHRGCFNGVSVMGIMLTHELANLCIEAAVSFEPEWNKKLTGDKRFDRVVRAQWEEELIAVPGPFSYEGEVYIAVPSDIHEGSDGEIGFFGQVSRTTPAEAERRLSCRFTAPFPTPAESDEGTWELEVGLFWGW